MHSLIQIKETRGLYARFDELTGGRLSVTQCASVGEAESVLRKCFS